jgi:hypothetical protein
LLVATPSDDDEDADDLEADPIEEEDSGSPALPIETAGEPFDLADAE